MGFFKDLLTKGLFQTMIDDAIDSRTRRFALFIVSFLYILLITGFTLIFIAMPNGNGKIAVGIIGLVFVFLFIRLYVRLAIHIYKRKKEKKILINKTKEENIQEQEESEEIKKYRT